MTTTSTSATPSGRHPGEPMERARHAYFKAGGSEQPSSTSDVHDINGTTIAILRNCNGVLAAYAQHGARLTRLSAGEAAAADLFAQAFGVPRDPRSAEYKAGALAALAFRIEGKPIPHPHQPGTAADDAYHAGIAEGHAIWRHAQEGGAA